MIDLMDNNEVLYTTASVKKLIDHQFEDTFNFYQRNFFIYLVFYFLPFLLSVVFIKVEIVDIIFNVSGAIVMLLLFLQELIQIKESWNTTYFLEPWNYIEFSSFFVYAAFLGTRVNNNFENDSTSF